MIPLLNYNNRYPKRDSTTYRNTGRDTSQFKHGMTSDLKGQFWVQTSRKPWEANT